MKMDTDGIAAIITALAEVPTCRRGAPGAAVENQDR
jgi:hypothetical protein